MEAGGADTGPVGCGGLCGDCTSLPDGVEGLFIIVERLLLALGVPDPELGGGANSCAVIVSRSDDAGDAACCIPPVDLLRDASGDSDILSGKIENGTKEIQCHDLYWRCQLCPVPHLR